MRVFTILIAISMFYAETAAAKKMTIGCDEIMKDVNQTIKTYRFYEIDTDAKSVKSGERIMILKEINDIYIIIIEPSFGVDLYIFINRYTGELHSQNYIDGAPLPQGNWSHVGTCSNEPKQLF